MNEPASDASLAAVPTPRHNRSGETLRLQLGIDVGGTSTKGAIIDLATGQLAGPIHNLQTPDAATPAQVAAIVRQIAAAEDWTGGVGVALPGVVAGSRLRHAPNLSGSWEHEGALESLRTLASTPTVLINDADAAGLAELTYGHARHSDDGLTVLLTFGTGIGSALLHNGVLISNTELGGIEHDAGRFEDVASGRAISEHNLTPAQWADRAQPYFDQLESLLNPSRWVLGGGLTEKFHQYASRLNLTEPVSPAHLGIHAGIVGAAAAAGRVALQASTPAER